MSKYSTYVPKNTIQSSLTSIIDARIAASGGGGGGWDPNAAEVLTNKDLTDPSNSFPNTLALTSDVVDLTNNQTIGGTKTFSNTPVFASSAIQIGNAGAVLQSISGAPSVELPTVSGQLALTSDIPTNSDYVDLTTNQSISGIKTFTQPPTIDSGIRFSDSLNGTSAIIQYGGSASNITLTIPDPFITNDTFLTSANVIAVTNKNLASATNTFSSYYLLNGSTQRSLGLSMSGNGSIGNSTWLTGMSVNCSSATYTDTVSSGTVATINDVLFSAKTISATNPTTYSSASTVTISGSLTPGTNVSFTNNDALRINASNLRLVGGRVLCQAVGTAALPIFSLGSSLNDGLYGVGAGNLGITTAGILRADINATRLNSTVPIYLPNGSVTAPALTFTNDTGVNSGFYLVANDVMGLAVGGNSIQTYQTTGVTSNGVSTLSGGVRVGGTAFTNMAQRQFGTLTVVAPNIGATTNITAVITFATAFSTAPQVLLTAFPAAGSTGFNRVILSVASSTTTNATINLYNTASGGGAATTGDVVIQYMAYV
jgi:hypothetical protein